MAVYFYGCITLDGYLATKEHGLDWLYATGSPEETGYDEFYRHMDVTLMGRRTFREVEKTENPAEAYPDTENYVFTHGELACPGFTPVSGDPAEFVKRLGPDRNIWVIGGNTILAPLLDQDMVDFLIIQVAPLLLGAGISLFTQKEVMRRFRLEAVRQYGQFAELVYGRTDVRQEENFFKLTGRDVRDSIRYRRSTEEDMPQIMNLQVEAFHKEQKIPLEDVKGFVKKNPQCWCAVQGDRVIGAVAAWNEGGSTHWGRFAVMPEYRGRGIGGKLARLSFEELFAQGIPSIYMEAREITAKMVCSMGGQPVGEPRPFFDGTVTPLILRKTEYEKI